MFIPVNASEQFNGIFTYDKSNGTLHWRNHVALSKARRLTAATDGQKHDRHNRQYVNLNGSRYPAEKIIWCMNYGYWPRGVVRHKDCMNGNNRLENLAYTMTELDRLQLPDHLNPDVGGTPLDPIPDW